MVACGQSPQGFLNHISRRRPGWSSKTRRKPGTCLLRPEDAKVPWDRERFYESQGTHIRGRRLLWLLVGGAHKVF